MSGGSFDYAYCRVSQFANELGLRLVEVNAVDEYGDKPNEVSDEAHAKLRSIERLARHVSQLMREAEWLYSGDTCSGTFLQRVREIEGANDEDEEKEMRFDLGVRGDEVEELQAEIERLRALLSEAIEEVENWGAYASPYFQQKHDLAGELKRLRSAMQGRR